MTDTQERPRQRRRTPAARCDVILSPAQPGELLPDEPGATATDGRSAVGMVDELRETHDIVVLEEHLARTYGTNVGRAAVHQAVRTAYRQFDGAPIRNYVVVLVEREARVRLAALDVGHGLTAEVSA